VTYALLQIITCLAISSLHNKNESEPVLYWYQRPIMSLRYAETSETAFSSNPVQILNFYCPKHPFRGTVCKTVCLMLPDRCPVCHVFLSVLSVTLVHCIMDGSRRNLARTVGLGPGHIVLDGDPASPPPKKKGAQSPNPIFGPCLLWPNGWMDQDAI